jgi:hypothetical protein
MLSVALPESVAEASTTAVSSFAQQTDSFMSTVTLALRVDCRHGSVGTGTPTVVVQALLFPLDHVQLSPVDQVVSLLAIV